MTSSTDPATGPSRSGTPAGARSGLAPRDVAAVVLERVWQGDAYASRALDAELSRGAQLDARDRGLVTQLVYGVLRCEGALLKKLRSHTTNGRWEKKPQLRAQLLMAAYSLYALDRIPPYAAVAAAVDAVQARHGKSMAGFCNAVLRKLANHRPEDRKQWLQAAAVRSLPRWLRRDLRAELGDELEVLLGTLDTPPLGLCLRLGQNRDSWLAQLRAAAPEATFSSDTLSPRAIRAQDAGDPRRLPGSGVAWRVQEEGAQLVGLSLGERPGARVLDACAGNGGKTLLLRELVGAHGKVTAADLHPRKLERLRQAAGDAVDDTFAVDWSRGSGDCPNGYDAALVDAPCSGTGTLRRRPEMIARLNRQQLADLQTLQCAITRRVATRVRNGGTLLYAVCSLLRSEAEEVLAQLAEPSDGLRLEPAPFENALAQGLAAGGHSFRLLPQRHGTDGYFVANLRVVRDGTS